MSTEKNKKSFGDMLAMVLSYAVAMFGMGVFCLGLNILDVGCIAAGTCITGWGTFGILSIKKVN